MIYGFQTFEMAAMPFPCNGILLIQGNLLRIFPVNNHHYMKHYNASEGKKKKSITLYI